MGTWRSSLQGRGEIKHKSLEAEVKQSKNKGCILTFVRPWSFSLSGIKLLEGQNKKNVISHLIKKLYTYICMDI